MNKIEESKISDIYLMTLREGSVLSPADDYLEDPEKFVL